MFCRSNCTSIKVLLFPFGKTGPPLGTSYSSKLAPAEGDAVAVIVELPELQIELGPHYSNWAIPTIID
jgi:hypothetical protein